MSFAFGSFTIGVTLLIAAFKKQNVLDVVLGKKGSTVASQTNPTVSATASVGGSGGGASTPTGASSNVSGVAKYGSKDVAKWIIPWLDKSKKAGWSGSVTSGYRTPEYSESLCFGMCDAPSCSGTCAGKSSNHSGKVYPAGAVDVTDESNFAVIQKKIGSPLKNNLPSDRVHFSVSGS